MKSQKKQNSERNQTQIGIEKFLRKDSIQRTASFFYNGFFGLLLLSSGASHAGGLSLLGGTADYNLDFVKKMVKEEIPMHETESEMAYTTELLSMLSANGVESVTLLNTLKKNGTTNLDLISKAIKKSGKNKDQVFLNTVGSSSSSNNKICRMMFEESEVAFVGAPGNGGIDLNEDLPELSFCRAPNIILVSALNKDQNGIADFSNFGNQLIRIAAPGVKIPAIGPEGKLSFRSGTGPAAAMVAARLEVFSQSHPELRGGDLIEEFLRSDEVLEDDDIRDQVEFGRRLRE